MSRSGIITLLTDFGLADPYVAMMKGVLLSINPRAILVDISHQIRAGSILHASSLIGETFSFFPVGTVHMAVVDPGVGGNRRPIGIKAGGHFFIGPDNGIFSTVLVHNREAEIIHLTEEKYFLFPITNTFHGRDIFAPVSAHISLGVDLRTMGQVIRNPVKRSFQAPFIKDNSLQGQIIRVDYFGNLITNIRNDQLNAFLTKSKPTVFIGNLKIKGIGATYSEVDEGEPLALINSSNLLEVAVNLGRASEYVGIDADEIVGASVKVGKFEGS